MKPRDEAVRYLKHNGYSLKRRGANHDIYFNPDSGGTIPLKRHDFDENDLRYILKEIKHNKKP
jgi:predicted RNA binding protein YcfA (HicA-like mRNA interferase family)